VGGTRTGKARAMKEDVGHRLEGCAALGAVGGLAGVETGSVRPHESVAGDEANEGGGCEAGAASSATDGRGMFPRGGEGRAR
jgi:hypothetical protein